MIVDKSSSNAPSNTVTLWEAEEQVMTFPMFMDDEDETAQEPEKCTSPRFQEPLPNTIKNEFEEGEPEKENKNFVKWHESHREGRQETEIDSIEKSEEESWKQPKENEVERRRLMKFKGNFENAKRNEALCFENARMSYSSTSNPHIEDNVPSGRESDEKKQKWDENGAKITKTETSTEIQQTTARGFGMYETKTDETMETPWALMFEQREHSIGTLIPRRPNLEEFVSKSINSASTRSSTSGKKEKPLTLERRESCLAVLSLSKIPEGCRCVDTGRGRSVNNSASIPSGIENIEEPLPITSVVEECKKDEYFPENKNEFEEGGPEMENENFVECQEKRETRNGDRRDYKE
ncbi:hypothetical protein M9H77_31161 [Catharanthus roseus]|uniref:Uncharacterized protein n=1 Tax=Catharanthus roseus TaxID=4058 RepID=A0ACC0A047_CATRO|nr:hypothetical protein M9H77_31161 [Catharanthus roseus]